MNAPVIIGPATLYCGDALAILPQLSGVDALLTDPPYSSGGQFRSDRMGDPRRKYFPNDSRARTLPDFSGDNRDQRAFSYWAALWSAAALQACRPGAFGMFFTDWRQLPASTDYMQAGGWVWRGIVPWCKPDARPQLGRFTAQCEYVIWGTAGALPPDASGKAIPGFYECVAPRDRVHVTQKPLPLLRELLRVVPSGALVLDPFMGSASTGVACLQTGRRFVGVELDPGNFETACGRIEDAHRQGLLFDATANTQEQARLTLG
ncbi:DNA-methyltransferase [Paraburkholderia caballeronis]|uniref:Methyltransferase n=1 Tax=Paraburkholderia caballeronis TaxID=416943 RepID=A0A1H7VRS0_9BURK|nr:DNA methyltransferase [Paraburkholderia caballeronis]PXW15503.1 site-specific DNA-methyltransferase (adenine-specific) [Paraburkholderia caballeronis]PXW93788.1 site-specific DNA-methyltransferase (adenine-specific) [Paraburkholderia caballeronis]RAJ89028.1 site-specific DNA-methyltransferase (adenine-specific) [Paraburkholderia caballeronis]SEE00079.1 site-specific DNA-methyltransferase (adenine-specific) [Paraburkholderia caballeronis]SEM11744.1 site-specific DNA-methyltransferase (adenin